jgi:hypothetical protein
MIRAISGDYCNHPVDPEEFAASKNFMTVLKCVEVSGWSRQIFFWLFIFGILTGTAPKRALPC